MPRLHPLKLRVREVCVVPKFFEKCIVRILSKVCESSIEKYVGFESLQTPVAYFNAFSNRTNP